MDDLIAFLRAQLDEDERVAKALDPQRHRDLATEVLSTAKPGAHLHALHVARWDSARVLAEVEAKRRILDLAPGAVMRALATQDPDFRDGYVAAHEDAIKALALPYAGRPGWQEEWAA